MTEGAKQNIVSYIKKGAAIGGAIMTINGFLLWLFMPHIDDYAEEKIRIHEESETFENRIFELATKYTEESEFKLMILLMQ